jgi:hypothetical protein
MSWQSHSALCKLRDVPLLYFANDKMFCTGFYCYELSSAVCIEVFLFLSHHFLLSRCGAFVLPSHCISALLEFRYQALPIFLLSMIQTCTTNTGWLWFWHVCLIFNVNVLIFVSCLMLIIYTIKYWRLETNHWACESCFCLTCLGSGLLVWSTFFLVYIRIKWPLSWLLPIFLKKPDAEPKGTKPVSISVQYLWLLVQNLFFTMYAQFPLPQLPL